MSNTNGKGARKRKAGDITSPTKHRNLKEPWMPGQSGTR